MFISEKSIEIYKTAAAYNYGTFFEMPQKPFRKDYLHNYILSNFSPFYLLSTILLTTLSFSGSISLQSISYNS